MAQFFSTQFGQILQAIIIIYIFFAAAFFLASDSVLYQPPAKNTSARYEQKDLYFKLQDNSKIHAAYLENPNAKYTILFSHGNAEDLTTLYPFIHILRQMGFNVLAYDYPGYGQSTGQSSEKRIYEAITLCYQYLTQTLQVPTDHIVLFGRSLGTAPSLYIAKTNKVHAVILEAPFLSAYRIMTRIGIFPFDKFQNIRYIKLVSSPVLIIQGTKDNVIPFYHGQRIFEMAKPPKKHFWVKNASHNDVIIVAGNHYFETISKFINNPNSNE